MHGEPLHICQVSRCKSGLVIEASPLAWTEEQRKPAAS